MSVYIQLATSWLLWLLTAFDLESKEKDSKIFDIEKCQYLVQAVLSILTQTNQEPTQIKILKYNNHHQIQSAV